MWISGGFPQVDGEPPHGAVCTLTPVGSSESPVEASCLRPRYLGQICQVHDEKIPRLKW